MLIRGFQYKSYRSALSLTSLPRLDTLRERATLKWAIKAQSNPLHSDMFPSTKAQLKQEDETSISNIIVGPQDTITVPFPI